MADGAIETSTFRRAPRRGTVSKAAVRRAVEGAQLAGVKVGRIEIVGGRIILSGLDDPSGDTQAEACERAMREAFGEE